MKGAKFDKMLRRVVWIVVVLVILMFAAGWIYSRKFEKALEGCGNVGSEGNGGDVFAELGSGSTE